MLGSLRREVGDGMKPPSGDRVPGECTGTERASVQSEIPLASEIIPWCLFGRDRADLSIGEKGATGIIKDGKVKPAGPEPLS